MSALPLRAALASVGTAAFLLGLKGVAAIATGSVAMLGSLADTALDLVASLVTLAGVRYAARPADWDHRFGHGKAEALTALFQVVLIAASAVAIAWQAVSRLGTGAVSVNAEFGVAVSALSITVTLVLLRVQRRAIKRTGSVAITADHLHYKGDVALNGGVIAALLLEQMAGLHGADPLFGIAIAAWLLWGAFRSATLAIDQLMDREWPAERREAFLRAAARHPQLRGVHDLRTRSAGTHDFVQFHVAVDPDMTVAEAHRVMDEVEAQLAQQFPGVEILIHPDPEPKQESAT
ncbi:cation diffusion facilitator family transporter [Sphingomonas jatrophae]|uniref:Ferrous-iron efflux pump FieF n=1 Tax=Sphingomonas jatrophae TaxID=1166337 RepID=A0A1I6KYB8_9SPHN|nr:cation diffusion facilitator family transporter [Sphingomonas jatrophae]SFR96205.1 ferrous-iron efflux pump FieF [Sphingomonas jatrophae]